MRGFLRGLAIIGLLLTVVSEANGGDYFVGGTSTIPLRNPAPAILRCEARNDTVFLVVDLFGAGGLILEGTSSVVYDTEGNTYTGNSISVKSGFPYGFNSTVKMRTTNVVVRIVSVPDSVKAFKYIKLLLGGDGRGGHRHAIVEFHDAPIVRYNK